MDILALLRFLPEHYSVLPPNLNAIHFRSRPNEVPTSGTRESVAAPKMGNVNARCLTQTDRGSDGG